MISNMYYEARPTMFVGQTDQEANPPTDDACSRPAVLSSFIQQQRKCVIQWLMAASERWYDESETWSPLSAHSICGQHIEL